MTGQIKFWDAQRYFGFICEADGRSLFFHGRQVVGGADGVREGDAVAYEISQTDRGPAAVRVELLELPEEAADAAGG